MLDIYKPLEDEPPTPALFFKNNKKVKEQELNNLLNQYDDKIIKPKKIDVFIKYEYTARNGDPCEEVYNITTTDNATIKYIKEELNTSFIYGGNLEPEQYEIYKGGEQEDTERTDREPQTYYYIYLEPILLNDNNKTLKECNIKNFELLHLKVKLKIMLYVPCCRFTTIYLYTYNTLEDIQKEAIKIFNNEKSNKLKPKQIKAFYGHKEIQEDEELSTYSIYNCSSITTDISYNIKD